MDAGLIFTPFVLTRLCEDHVRRAYHPRARLTCDWYSTSTEYFSGYSSPAHPAWNQTYLVTVTARRRTYCYAIDSAGVVSVHYVKEGKRRTELAVPDLLAGN